MTASSATTAAGAPSSSQGPRTGESSPTSARAKERFRVRPREPHGRPVERVPLRRRRPDEEAAGGPIAGGPLSHQSNHPPGAVTAGLASVATEAPVRVSQVADRILTGVDAGGRATARIELNLGDWAGVDVDLVAGARGLELNVFAATAAARRTIQAQLTDLANALAQRGLKARKIEVTVRRRDNRGGTRQDDPR